MYAYLSKKLEMSNGAAVRCLAWSNTNNYLASGCDNGLLKVLKIDAYKDKGYHSSDTGVHESSSIGYLASPSNILLNQTLEGHSSPIQQIAWNNVHNKLTTSDSRGLIVVWMLYKGSWYEEMVNNRNKSTVRGLSWSSDGEKICIVYEDGGVIVGSLDGNRLWSKELRSSQLTGVCWSPNSSFLLFAHSNGEIHVYNSEGNYVSKLALDGGKKDESGLTEAITKVSWHPSEQPHKLAVIFRENSLYLLSGIHDSCPLAVSTGLTATCGEWSPNGLYIGIGGLPFTSRAKAASSTENVSKVRIFSANAVLLFELSLPTSSTVVDLAWDSWNLRLAIGVGSNVFFANVRPYYKATFFGESTLLYVHSKSNSKALLTFWDQKEINSQEILGNVLNLKGYGDICGILTETNGVFTIAVTNIHGNVIDSLKVEGIQPFRLILSSFYVISLGRSGFVAWKYSKKTKRNDPGNRRDTLYNIDTNEEIFPSSTSFKQTKDPCLSIDGNENIFVIGRESGALHVFSIHPRISLLQVISPSSEIPVSSRIFLNMDGTNLAILDSMGSLSTLSLQVQQKTSRGKGNCKRYDKKDIWDFLWASDNPNLFCIMEKTRLYIVNNGEMEEPIVSSGYLLTFQNLEVVTILLDELMKDAENIPTTNLLVKHEAKRLRDTKALIESDANLERIFEYIEENGHPILWKVLAKKALFSLNFKLAETSFVRCKDYNGIQFTKRISSKNHTTQSQLASISAFYNDFKTAETYFREAGKKEMVMEMWTLLGKWHFVDIENIREAQMELDEESMKTVYCEIGDGLAEDGDWKGARAFYELGKDQQKLFNTYLILEDYVSIGNLIPQLEHQQQQGQSNHSLLRNIGNVFASVGFCEMAVYAYACGGYLEDAVETCINLNRWNLAMELAQDYNLPSSGRVMVMYASHLISQDEIMQAIDLFRSSNRPFYGAVIAVMLALKFLESDEFNVMLVRKLFGLGGILVKPSGQLLAEEIGPQTSLDSLFELYMPAELIPPTDVLSWIQWDPWRGLNAINCFIQVQRKIYTQEYREAIKRGVYLLEYVDTLGEERVGCIIGLTAANWEAFHVASQAFMLLEAFDSSYNKISFSLFSDLDPIDLVEIQDLNSLDETE